MLTVRIYSYFHCHILNSNIVIFGWNFSKSKAVDVMNFMANMESVFDHLGKCKKYDQVINCDEKTVF